jgi:hypothetical protein
LFIIFIATGDYVGFYFVIILLHLSLSQKKYTWGICFGFIAVCGGLLGPLWLL